jgi:hypothetical protein
MKFIRNCFHIPVFSSELLSENKMCLITGDQAKSIWNLNTEKEFLKQFNIKADTLADEEEEKQPLDTYLRKAVAIDWDGTINTDGAVSVYQEKIWKEIITCFKGLGYEVVICTVRSIKWQDTNQELETLARKWEIPVVYAADFSSKSEAMRKSGYRVAFIVDDSPGAWIELRDEQYYG